MSTPEPQAHPPTGEELGQETVPQGVVEPGTGPLQSHGPGDLDDLIVHTGEARGLADTSRESLEPDAPTTGAAAARPDPESAAPEHASTSPMEKPAPA